MQNPKLLREKWTPSSEHTAKLPGFVQAVDSFLVLKLWHIWSYVTIWYFYSFVHFLTIRTRNFPIPLNESENKGRSGQKIVVIVVICYIYFPFKGSWSAEKAAGLRLCRRGPRRRLLHLEEKGRCFPPGLHPDCSDWLGF